MRVGSHFPAKQFQPVTRGAGVTKEVSLLLPHFPTVFPSITIQINHLHILAKGQFTEELKLRQLYVLLATHKWSLMV